MRSISIILAFLILLLGFDSSAKAGNTSPNMQEQVNTNKPDPRPTKAIMAQSTTATALEKNGIDGYSYRSKGTFIKYVEDNDNESKSSARFQSAWHHYSGHNDFKCFTPIGNMLEQEELRDCVASTRPDLGKSFNRKNDPVDAIIASSMEGF